VGETLELGEWRDDVWTVTHRVTCATLADAYDTMRAIADHWRAAGLHVLGDAKHDCFYMAYGDRGAGVFVSLY